MSIINFGPEFHEALFGPKRPAGGSAGAAPAPPALRPTSTVASATALQTPETVVSITEKYAHLNPHTVRFEDLVKNISYKKRTSASDSLLLIADLTLTGERVFMKITVKPAILKNKNSNVVEGAVYLNVVDKLISQHTTPHLLSGVGFYECTGMSSSLYRAAFRNAEDRERACKAWRRLFRDEYAESVHDTACVLVTQYDGNGQSLGDVVPNSRTGQTIPVEQFRSIICQILYTLEAFNQSDPPLRHNDLHLGNILIDSVADGIMTYVLSDTEAYAVPTHGCFARIFDFDWAFAGKINMKLEPYDVYDGVCNDEGQCNAVNKVFDTYFLVSLLNQYGRETYLQTVFPEEVGNTQVYNDPNPFGKYRNHMCHVPQNKVRGKSGACYGEITEQELEDLEIPTTRQMFVTAAAPYRVDIGTVDLHANTTFFVSRDLAQRLRGADQSFIPKVPIRMVRECAPPSNWPTDFMDGAPYINETMFEDLIAWLCSMAIEINIINLAEIVYAFEHLAYFIVSLKTFNVGEVRLRTIGAAFCAYVWDGPVDVVAWAKAIFGVDKATPYHITSFETEYSYVKDYMMRPEFCTMYEHLYACGTPPPPGAARMMCVMALSAPLYKIPPEERALFIQGHDMPRVTALYTQAEAALEAAHDERTDLLEMDLEVFDPDLSAEFSL